MDVTLFLIPKGSYEKGDPVVAAVKKRGTAVAEFTGGTIIVPSRLTPSFWNWNPVGTENMCEDMTD